MEPILVRAQDRRVQQTAHGGNVLKEVIYAQESGLLPKGTITQIAIGCFPARYTEDNSHVHKTMWQLDFVLEGELMCIIEGHGEYHLSEGDFLATPPGMPHRQTTGLCIARTLYLGIAIDR